jgi:HK97 family phage portal protein
LLRNFGTRGGSDAAPVHCERRIFVPIRRAFDFVRKAFSNLATPQRWFKESLGVEESISGVDVSVDSSLGCAEVLACTRLLAESVASLPLHTFVRTQNDKQRDMSHPLYRILHSQPNPYQTSFTWRSQAMGHTLLRGNSYSLIDRDSSGNVTALWPLLPENVTVKTDGGEIRYEYFHLSERRTYDFSQILHLKGFSLNGITGLGLIDLARQSIGLSMVQLQHAAASFKNKARPAIALKSPGKLSQEARNLARESFADNFAGALNTGKAVILDPGWELQTLGFNAEEAQLIQGRQFSVQEIARIFRVSPALIADMSRSTYSNIESEMLSFLIHSLRPWLVNFEQEFSLKLFSGDDKHFSEFDISGIARGDQAARYEAYSKGIAGGFLTVADIRRWENLPFIEGSDVLNRPANLLPAQGTNNE